MSKAYGLFFDLEDGQGLEKQMNKIVDGEYDYQEKNKVADDICQRYSWESLIDSYIEVYKDM